jgi:hypothetical protein
MHIDPQTGALHLWEDRLPITPHMSKVDLQALTGITGNYSDHYPPSLGLDDGTERVSITFMLQNERLTAIRFRLAAMNEPDRYEALRARLGAGEQQAWGDSSYHFSHSGTDFDEYLVITYNAGA